MELSTNPQLVSGLGCEPMIVVGRDNGSDTYSCSPHAGPPPPTVPTIDLGFKMLRWPTRARCVISSLHTPHLHRWPLAVGVHFILPAPSRLKQLHSLPSLPKFSPCELCDTLMLRVAGGLLKSTDCFGGGSIDFVSFGLCAAANLGSAPEECIDHRQAWPPKNPRIFLNPTELSQNQSRNTPMTASKST